VSVVVFFLALFNLDAEENEIEINSVRQTTFWYLHLLFDRRNQSEDWPLELCDWFAGLFLVWYRPNK